MVRLKQNLDHLHNASPAAKLTAPVNIAVFAAFSFCIRCVLLSDAEFKPRRGGGNLTFGVMGGKNGKKWQETATIWQGGRRKRRDLARL
jgi:hypothetical protein